MAPSTCRRGGLFATGAIVDFLCIYLSEATTKRDNFLLDTNQDKYFKYRHYDFKVENYQDYTTNETLPDEYIIGSQTAADVLTAKRCLTPPSAGVTVPAHVPFEMGLV